MPAPCRAHEHYWVNWCPWNTSRGSHRPKTTVTTPHPLGSHLVHRALPLQLWQLHDAFLVVGGSLILAAKPTIATQVPTAAFQAPVACNLRHDRAFD